MVIIDISDSERYFSILSVPQMNQRSFSLGCGGFFVVVLSVVQLRKIIRL